MIAIYAQERKHDYMQERKIYLIKEVKIHINDRNVTVESLVHEGGLKRVFEKNNLPAGIGELVGKLCTITFDQFKFKGRFSREATPLGTFYNARFNNLTDEDRKKIRQEISQNGLPAPWKRRYARISTTSQDEEDLPVPFLAVGKGPQFEGLFFNVLNFTLGGVLLEISGEDSFEPRLNQEIYFDLIANTGEKIENMKGVVMHTNEDVREKDGSRNNTFGIRMMPMNMISEVKYNNIIRDFLMGYKKKMKMR